MRIREGPRWWSWDLELSSHLLRRMVDRGFNEVDLRGMLARGSRLREDVLEGRWVVTTRHDGGPWEVIVEPDDETRRIVVITAYSLK